LPSEAKLTKWILTYYT